MQHDELPIDVPPALTKLCRRMDLWGILEVAAAENIEDRTYSFRAKIIVFGYCDMPRFSVNLVQRHWRRLVKWVIEDYIRRAQLGSEVPHRSDQVGRKF
jgi:hypothetical protein